MARRYHPARAPHIMDYRDRVHDEGGTWRHKNDIDPLIIKILNIEETYSRSDLPYSDRPVLEKLRK
ncbi:MAG: hypothetical protein AABW52_02885, partial [Nanoarchaeota archaeon]